MNIEKIRKSVGIIPWWMRYFPGFTNISGFFLKDRFLLSPKLYKDLMSNKPSEYTIGLVIHELEHIQRAKEVGYLKYKLKYSTNSKFRYREELSCHKVQFKYLKEVDYNFNIESRAKILSGSLYL